MKAIKFTKAALEKLNIHNKTYRDQDQQTVGLSIEVKAAPSNLKVYYAEWSNIVTIRMLNKKDWAVEGRSVGMARNQSKQMKKLIQLKLKLLEYIKLVLCHQMQNKLN